MHRAELVAPFVLVLAGFTSGTDEPAPASTAPGARAAVITAATFTGAGCTYNSPPGFVAGSIVTLTVTKEPPLRDSGFAVWEFTDGATHEGVRTESVLRVGLGGDNPAGVDPPTTLGQPYRMAVTLEEPGPYGINCYRSPGPDVATDGVTMVAVNLAETDQADHVTWQAPVRCLPDA